MKKLVTILFLAVATVCSVSAQQKGDSYLGLNLGYNTSTSTLTTTTTTDSTNIGDVSPHSAIDNLKPSMYPIDCNSELQKENISLSDIRKNAKYLNWTLLCSKKILTEDIIREFYMYMDWTQLCTCQKLPETLIREFADKFNWAELCKYQKLSEELMRDYIDRRAFILQPLYVIQSRYGDRSIRRCYCKQQ